MTTHLLEDLNEAQREAVAAIKGPLLIIAGPGSGKTRVITHRIAYLVRTIGVSPHHILAVTFTNKAAKEMKDRLQRLVGTQTNYLTVGTFHAFGASVLRRYGQYVGLDSGFSIFDNEDQMELVKAAMEESEVDPKQFPRRSILGIISRAKSVLLDAQGLGTQQTNYFEEVSARVYARYEELLAQNNAVDFDDLLLKTVLLFRNTPEVLSRYQERYVHLLIDEFQDTNVVQYTLAKLLAENYRNICVVGDPDQSIYSWRSADIRNILSFQKDYTDAKVVNLELNYRSTGTILKAARGVIAVNRRRLVTEIRTSREEGLPLTVHEAFTENEEALYVIRQIDLLIRDNAVKRSECAVMYRVNAQSRALEEACLQQGMPYRLVGGVRFYQRREVKDIISYLRLINNPEDHVSLTRVINKPPRGIGQRSVSHLVQWARNQNISLHSALQLVYEGRTEDDSTSHPLARRATQSIFGFVTLLRNLRVERDRLDIVDLIDVLLDRTGFRSYLQSGPDNWEERWENVLELRSAAIDFRDLGPTEGLTTFLEQLALVADVDSHDEVADAVTLITLHQAKGLEFPVVFITGMEEGLLPHIRSMDSPEEIEEERRLCYVGITRCMDQLFLTRAFRRSIRGTSGPTIPSRFLEDVPPHLIKSAEPTGHKRTVWNTSTTPAMEREAMALPVFKTGDKVSHATFGEGLVVNCAGTGADSEVTVAFVGGTGVKRLLVSYAPLEKVES